MNGLNLLVLRCRDIDATRQFYERLGFTFERHAHGNGPEHYAHESDDGVLELYPANPQSGPDSAGLGFASAAIEDLAAAFADHGYEPGPITTQPWGTTFVVRDPDGRRIEIKAS